jgi:[acyl-carrier-protein] S-malonyltransferase
MKDTEGRWRYRIPGIDAGQRLSRLAWSRMARASGGSTRSLPEKTKKTKGDLKSRIGTAAFAFRGYDVTNLGRSPELLAHPAYGPIVRAVLDEASELCAEATGGAVDLAARVAAREPSSLATFAQDIATIIAIEVAQLRLLNQVFDVPVQQARMGFGYSLGELAAMIYGGVYQMRQLLPVPLGLARDCAELAEDTSLGILFTRGPALEPEDVQRLCVAISSQGKGLIGPSAFLSPNTALVLGQGDTLDRLEAAMPEYLPGKAMLRRNPHRWPPLHTPLVWQRNIPNRAAVAAYRIEGGMKKPSPPIYSCVTGAASYDELNSRQILVDWTDHPQHLWDVIYDTLAAGVELVIHVGPEPTMIPATFTRISDNVSKQVGSKYLHLLGNSVIPGMSKYAWLSHLLPSKTALLRAPFLEHVILEDWLLQQAV